MDEKCRSTTPPAPPPEPSEILLTSQHAHAQHEPPPPGAQREAQEATGEGMEHETQLQEPRMDLSRQSKLPRPANSKTPELPRAIQISSHQMNGHGYSGSLSHAAHLAPERSRTPDTPGAGSLSPFDWDDLEARFEKALASANEHEDGLMGEFESLVRYFKIWASTAASHDNGRASKRIQTRTHFVKIREEDLASRKENYEQVVSAFQNAMVLLHRTQT